MAVRSGNGGYILVGATTLHVGKWTGNFTSRLVENTNSASGGATNFEHVVQHNEWSLEIPWDEANLPEATVGLVRGAKVTITFKMGAGSKTYVLANTTVETVNPADDNAADIVRMTATGKGGSLTSPT